MKTIDFSTILFESLQVAGQDRYNIQPETFSQFRDFANARLRFAWDAFEWPDAVRVSELTLTTENGVTFAVYPANAVDILHVYVNNPLSTTSNKEVSFKIYQDGATKKLIFLSNPETAWVEYKIEKPVVFGDAWSASVSYRVGAQAYFDSGSSSGSIIPVVGFPHSGNFYKCLINTNIGESPSTAPTKWQKVEIPYFMASYVPRAVHADWLRSEMQIELAGAAEQVAEYVLTEEIGKVTRTQGQTDRLNFIYTY
jgi:hypothetical protein